MKIWTLLFLACLTSASGHAVARASVPIMTFEKAVVVNASGKAPSESQVKQAIFSAAAVKQWSLRETAPGVMLATLVVRNKHTVVTEIRYSADKYTLVLVQSDNMNQAIDKEGKPVIHPYYNKWAQELSDEIRVTLMRL